MGRRRDGAIGATGPTARRGDRADGTAGATGPTARRGDRADGTTGRRDEVTELQKALKFAQLNLTKYGLIRQFIEHLRQVAPVHRFDEMVVEAGRFGQHAVVGLAIARQGN